MKGFCLIQYFPYQYDQFKNFIEKMDLDWGRRYDLRVSSTIPRMAMIVNNHEIPFSNCTEFMSQYDYMIYTGQSSKIIDTLGSYTKSGIVFYIPHSLVGTIYDTNIALTSGERSVGLIPKCWSNFSSYKHAIEKYINDVGANPRVINTKTNPILMNLYEDKIPTDEDRRVIKSNNTIGIILGHKNPFETYKNDLLKYMDDHGIEKAEVRMHMLSYDQYDSIFGDNDRFYPNNPYEDDKYEFLNRHKYIVGAPSTLVIEALLRNEKFNLGQEIYRFRDKRQIESDLPELGVDKWEPHNALIYKDFILDNSDEVVEEYSEIITKYIEDNNKWKSRY